VPKSENIEGTYVYILAKEVSWLIPYETLNPSQRGLYWLLELFLDLFWIMAMFVPSELKGLDNAKR